MTVITQVFYDGDGVTTQFSIPFDYIDQTHVKVGILNTETGAYDEKAQDDPTYGWYLANATTVEFNVAPPAPVNLEVPNIKIYRETDSDTAYAVFSPGSPIKAADLNDNFEQSIYIAQESATISQSAEDLVEEVAALAVATKIIADQAAEDSAAALATAEDAETTADSSLALATTADANATQAIADSAVAVQTATSASNTAFLAALDADAALIAADSAETAAQQAETDAANAVSTANTALSTANTANSNANTALSTANTANSTANTALTQSNTAITDSSQAVATANAAAAAVSDAIIFEQIPNVAAIPGSPADDDAVQINDSTGIESFTPLAGVPTGFVGDPGLNVKINYTTTGATWNWVSYDANDPDDRYLGPADQAELIKRDGSVAYTAAQQFADGSVSTPSVNFGTGKGLNATDAGLQLVLDGIAGATLSASGLDVALGLSCSSLSVNGRDISTDLAKLDGIESNATRDQTASEILDLLKTVDGPGSGLDSDYLDNQEGSYYLDYNNFVNTPTLVTASTQLTDSNDLVRRESNGDVIFTGSLYFPNAPGNGFQLGWTPNLGGRLSCYVDDTRFPLVRGVSNGNNFELRWDNGSQVTCIVDGAAFVSLGTTSDYRIKDNVTSLSDAVAKVKALNPVTYNIKPYEFSYTSFEGSDDVKTGFIAHELQEVFPDAATGTKDDPNMLQGIELTPVVAGLTKALQEALDRIEVLEERLNQL